MKTEKSFTLNVYTPERLFLTDDVESLVFSTPDGQRGILKNHMAAVFAVECGVLTARVGNTQTDYAVSDGFLEVEHNVVNVYVNNCNQGEDPAAARAEAEAFRRRERSGLRAHRRNEIHLVRILAGTRKKR